MTKTSNALLGMLIIQNTVAVLNGRYVSSNHDYDVRHLLIVAEGMKLILALSIEKNSETKRHSGLCESLYKHMWLDPLDALKLIIPALLYLCQNVFGYIAIRMIPVPLFLIIQQTKLVKTTLLSMILLKRSYSLIQFLSILSLCIGSGICFISIMVQVPEHKVIEEEEDGSHIRYLLVQYKLGKNLFGIILVLSSNFCSSLASVYFELVIKGVNNKHTTNNDETTRRHSKDNQKSNNLEFRKLLSDTESHKNVDGNDLTLTETSSTGSNESSSIDSIEVEIDKNDEKDEKDEKDEMISTLDKEVGQKQVTLIEINENQASIWMRNIQLGLFTLIIIVIDEIATLSSDEEISEPMFDKFDFLMWIQIFLFAFGGLLVALVIQKADNIQRGLCLGLSVVLTSGISIVFDKTNHGMSKEFVLGAIMSIGGCFIFANQDIIHFNKVHLVSFVLLLLIVVIIIAVDFLPHFMALKPL